MGANNTEKSNGTHFRHTRKSNRIVLLYLTQSKKKMNRTGSIANAARGAVPKHSRLYFSVFSARRCCCLTSVFHWSHSVPIKSLPRPLLAVYLFHFQTGAMNMVSRNFRFCFASISTDAMIYNCAVFSFFSVHEQPTDRTTVRLTADNIIECLCVRVDGIDRLYSGALQ